MAKRGKPKTIKGHLIPSTMNLTSPEWALLDFLAAEYTDGNRTALIRIALGMFDISAATSGTVTYPEELRGICFFENVKDDFLREVGIENPVEAKAA